MFKIGDGSLIYILEIQMFVYVTQIITFKY